MSCGATGRNAIRPASPKRVPQPRAGAEEMRVALPNFRGHHHGQSLELRVNQALQREG